MSHHDGQSAPDAHDDLTPAQRYVITIALSTVETYEAYSPEAVARWLAPPPQTTLVTDPADLPGALVFAYDLAVRQIKQLLAIIDTLTGGAS